MSSVWLWLQLPTCETDLCCPRHMGCITMFLVMHERTEEKWYLLDTALWLLSLGHILRWFDASEASSCGVQVDRREKKCVVGSASPRLENKQQTLYCVIDIVQPVNLTFMKPNTINLTIIRRGSSYNDKKICYRMTQIGDWIWKMSRGFCPDFSSQKIGQKL